MDDSWFLTVQGADSEASYARYIRAGTVMIMHTGRPPLLINACSNANVMQKTRVKHHGESSIHTSDKADIFLIIQTTLKFGKYLKTFSFILINNHRLF